MEWHINDLSLAGQFKDLESLKVVLEPLLKFRFLRPGLGSRLYCSRLFCLRPALRQITLTEALRDASDRNFRQLAFRWIGNSGPFWDDDRAFNADDLFYFGEEDVTDQGLGEAARRNLLRIEAGTYSFGGVSSALCESSLVVHHGLLGDPIRQLQILNFTNVEELLRSCDAPPNSWQTFIEQIQTKFGLLLFSGSFLEVLQPLPYFPAVARRAIELLKVLEELVTHSADDGSLDERGMELLQMHFVGEKAWFTDESPDNKRDFRDEMTFIDPGTRAKLFCPWHGKIKIEQFRIHFEWPRPQGQRVIKVLYIGPKITKR